MYRNLTRFAALIITIVSTAAARADDPPADQPKTEVKDYTELSKLLHRVVTANVQKEVENRSQWGKTIPFPPKLLLPNAKKRTVVRVGDHDELPHGPWRRLKVWIDDPASDVTIRVRDFVKIDAKTYRLSLEAQASVHGEGEAQRWVNGLMLARVQAQADCKFGLAMDCDVAVKLKTDVFPPEVIIEPKVAECKIAIKEFVIRKIGDVQLEGDLFKDLGIDLRAYLQQLATTFEPQIRQRINDGVAQGLREGKGPNLLELLKVVK